VFAGGRHAQVVDGRSRYGRSRTIQCLHPTEFQNTAGAVLLTARVILRWWDLTGFGWHDVARLGVFIEMQLDTTSFQLPQHTLNSPFDGRVVSAVASDEFQNDGSERHRCQFRVWDAHRTSLADQ